MRIREIIDAVHEKVGGSTDPRDLLTGIGSVLVSIFEADEFIICIKPQNSPDLLKVTSGAFDLQKLTFDDGAVRFEGKTLALPLVIRDVTRSLADPSFISELTSAKVKSLLVVDIDRKGFVAIAHTSSYHSWRRERVAILEQVLDYALIRLEKRESAPINGALTTKLEVDTRSFESLPVAWATLDSEMRLTGVSRKFCELLGVSRDGAIGSKLTGSGQEGLVSAIQKGVDRASSDPKSSYDGSVELPSMTGGNKFLSIKVSFDPATRVSMVVLLEASAAPSLQIKSQLDRATKDFLRLVDYENVILIRTDKEFRVTEVFGNTESIIGREKDSFLNDPSVWTRIIDPVDARRLSRKVARSALQPSEISDEIQVRNPKTGEVRWLMVKGVPLLDTSKNIAGWEGFGLDITERRVVQQELLAQSKRVEALYEVSQSLDIHVDPAIVMLRAIKSLLHATNGQGGFGCFRDPRLGNLELVAAHGLSKAYVEGLSKFLAGPSLLGEAIDKKEGFLFDNVQDQPKAAVDLAKREGVKSSIVMPLISEDIVLGGFVLFRKNDQPFTKADFELVRACARQVCLVVQQAEMYASERRHRSSVEALYKLSHELSKHLTPKEVAEFAFPIINEEIPSRRLWLGVLNEQSSHIVGQAGWDAGMRRAIVNVQLELNLRHDFLDEAIREGKAIVVPSGTSMECSGLNRILAKLRVGNLIILPLTSLGQVIGALVVEPLAVDLTIVERTVPLLNSMANEIANVILARRFEARMADAEKVRMVGLLASGVAHNFNNLLQAVMGQASLIEMQLPKGSTLVNSARMIVDSASRGASLISQLLSCTVQEGQTKSRLNVRSVLLDSKDFYRSILGSDAQFSLDVEENLPEIMADSSKVQLVMTNLLVNAKEAVSGRPGSRVDISAKRVRLVSGEVDPDLPPGVYTQIDVRDNGIGMDLEQQSRCFDPFFTTKALPTGGVGGSGLGLSSAQMVVRQLDGIITVRSEKGNGTTFSIFIPALLAQEDGKDLLDQKGKHDKPEVVMFEVDDAVLGSVSSISHSLGFGTAAVAKRSELIELVKNRASEIRLLILDLDRISEDVGSFIQSVRKQHPTLPVIVSSVDTKRWNRVLGSMGRVEFIQKPLSVWALDSLIKRVLSGHDRLEKEIVVESYSKVESKTAGKGSKGKASAGKGKELL